MNFHHSIPINNKYFAYHKVLKNKIISHLSKRIVFYFIFLTKFSINECK
jgi:hypothetical protein